MMPLALRAGTSKADSSGPASAPLLLPRQLSRGNSPREGLGQAQPLPCTHRVLPVAGQAWCPAHTPSWLAVLAPAASSSVPLKHVPGQCGLGSDLPLSGPHLGRLGTGDHSTWSGPCCTESTSVSSPQWAQGSPVDRRLGCRGTAQAIFTQGL